MLCKPQATIKRQPLIGGSILALTLLTSGVTGTARADDWYDWEKERGERGDEFELTDDGYIHACAEKTKKVRLVNSSEDCKKKETYVYWNQKDTRIGVKNVDGETSAYTINSSRYHVEATKAFEGTTVPLDMAIVRDLCQDEDGCTVTLSMKDWNPDQPGNVATRGPTKLFMSQTSDWWRISPAVDVIETRGIDGDGIHQNDIMTAWDCRFTESEYSQGSWSDDMQGFGLVSKNKDFDDPNMVCLLDIDD
ncbi:MAG: hypothetical protein V7785_08185 [Bermanella sp.]